MSAANRSFNTHTHTHTHTLTLTLTHTHTHTLTLTLTHTHTHTLTHTHSGVSVGLYLTSSPEACYTIAESSKANIVVVENDSQLQKILQVSGATATSSQETVLSSALEISVSREIATVMPWLFVELLSISQVVVSRTKLQNN